MKYLSAFQIGGVITHALRKQDFFTFLLYRLGQHKKTFVTTLYSEFLNAGMRDPEIRKLLNSADVAVADGVMIPAGLTYLEQPLTAPSFFGKVVQAVLQGLVVGFQILFTPRHIYRLIPEKIEGSNLLFEMCDIAAREKYSVYFLGGFGDTPKKTAEIMQSRFPALTIAGFSNKNPEDNDVVAQIQAANPNILFVAFGPLRQERWIREHMHELPASIYIGVGGSFDYAVGAKTAPPAWVRRHGLEWLFRLLTQPKRIRRILHATVGLCIALLRYKVCMASAHARVRKDRARVTKAIAEAKRMG
jgi:exopolysaccharide biosynthesis WecB/TagA/CpsF family protein